VNTLRQSQVARVNPVSRSLQGPGTASLPAVGPRTGAQTRSYASRPLVGGSFANPGSGRSEGWRAPGRSVSPGSVPASPRAIPPADARGTEWRSRQVAPRGETALPSFRQRSTDGSRPAPPGSSSGSLPRSGRFAETPAESWRARSPGAARDRRNRSRPGPAAVPHQRIMALDAGSPLVRARAAGACRAGVPPIRAFGAAASRRAPVPPIRASGPAASLREPPGASVVRSAIRAAPALRAPGARVPAFRAPGSSSAAARRVEERAAGTRIPCAGARPQVGSRSPAGIFAAQRPFASLTD
jgi:hypothetical protein